MEKKTKNKHEERLHDVEGRDILRKICVGKGIDVGSSDRPISEEVDTLDLSPVYDPTFVANILNMPIDDGKYDFLIASHILEHVDNTIDALREIKRVVRDGGKIGIIVPHGEYVDYLDLGDTSMTHRMLFTVKTLEKYLLHVGFKIIKLRRIERPLASLQTPAILAIVEK